MLVLYERTYGRKNERANECPAEQKDDRNDRRMNEQADGRSIFVCVCVCACLGLKREAQEKKVIKIRRRTKKRNKREGAEEKKEMMLLAGDGW